MTQTSPAAAPGTAVTLNEYAWAMAGTAQGAGLDCIGNTRGSFSPPGAPPAARPGGPNRGGKFWLARVSATRQGVIATKARASVDTTSASCEFGTAVAAPWLSAWVGCQ